MATRTEPDRERLQRRRIEAGLNRTQLAQRAGISKQLMSMVEKGSANPSPESLSRIAKALDCEVADLLPIDEALARVKQLVGLMADGSVTLSVHELPTVAGALGVQLADVAPEDLAEIAEALECEVADLLPTAAPAPDTGSGG